MSNQELCPERRTLSVTTAMKMVEGHTDSWEDEITCELIAATALGAQTNVYRSFFSFRLTNRTNIVEKDQKFLETAQSNVALNGKKHFELCFTEQILDV
jgi:hypothetical protein